MIWYILITSGTFISTLLFLVFYSNHKACVACGEKFIKGKVSVYKYQQHLDDSHICFAFFLIISIFVWSCIAVFLHIDYDESKNQMSYIHRYYYEQGYNSYVSETIEKSPPYWIDSYNRAWLNGYSSHSKN